MKGLLAGIMFLTSVSVYALEFTTQDYDVRFHSRYSDARGKDTACSVSIIDGKDLIIPEIGITVIRIEAVGAGRWLDLSIPSDRLPLMEGDSFLIESVIGDKRLTYKNGVLSYQIENLEDRRTGFNKHDIGDLKIAPDLSSIEELEARRVTLKKSFFNRIKVVDLMNIQCDF